jgi:hypothetical protein
VGRVEPTDPVLPPEPPTDAEDWTDEEWLDWLSATDAQFGPADPAPPARPDRARRTGAQVVGQAMVGMARAIYGVEHDEIVIVAAGDDQPDADEPFSVTLDPEHPERSRVVFRDGPADPG